MKRTHKREGGIRLSFPKTLCVHKPTSISSQTNIRRSSNGNVLCRVKWEIVLDQEGKITQQDKACSVLLSSVSYPIDDLSILVLDNNCPP